MVSIPLPALRGTTAGRTKKEDENRSAEDIEAEKALLADAAADDEGDGQGSQKMIDLPMLIRNRPDGWHDIKDDDEKYKLDIESRPDAPTLESYENVKVEDIGMGMLRGMGWKPGQGVGARGKERVIEPIQFLKRPDGLAKLRSMRHAQYRFSRFASTKRRKQSVR